MIVMAKSPKNRHKNPPLYLRPHPSIRQQLDRLAQFNGGKMSQEAIRLIREGLQREGFWPPPAEPKQERKK
jgi:hypothetical protein